MIASACLTRAETPGAFGMAVRWTHVPAWVLIVSLVGFVRVYLRSGGCGWPGRSAACARCHFRPEANAGGRVNR
jgi:hypothetical protein